MQIGLGEMNRLNIILLTFLIASCSQSSFEKTDFHYDYQSLDSYQYFVTEINKLNSELESKLGDFHPYSRQLMNNALDTLELLEEFIINKSGGYQEGHKGLNNYLMNDLKNPSETIRLNPYGITIEYLNRIPEYLKRIGDPNAHPIARNSDDKGKTIDYFDLAFSNGNVWQCLIVISEIKMMLLIQEQRYLQFQLNNE